jgi:hypothetical protein
MVEDGMEAVYFCILMLRPLRRSGGSTYWNVRSRRNLVERRDFALLSACLPMVSCIITFSVGFFPLAVAVVYFGTDVTVFEAVVSNTFGP